MLHIMLSSRRADKMRWKIIYRVLQDSESCSHFKWQEVSDAQAIAVGRRVARVQINSGRAGGIYRVCVCLMAQGSRTAI